MVLDTEKITNDLQTRGWYLHTGHESEIALRQSFGFLGDVLLQSHIKILHGFSSPPTPNTPFGMRLHTDAPCADYVLWHCLCEGEVGEFIQLCHVNHVINLLSSQEKKALSRLYADQVSMEAKHQLISSYFDFPVLYGSNLECMNFAHWLSYGTQENVQHAAIKKLRTAVEDTILSSAVESIFLRKGQVLVVDNKRLLHGRTVLSEHSRRFHMRYWFRSNMNRKAT
ncbi:MAG: hypothetical protein RRB13_10210 [bacterium]|nr:hypothetical protein [bacterium]